MQPPPGFRGACHRLMVSGGLFALLLAGLPVFPAGANDETVAPPANGGIEAALRAARWTKHSRRQLPWLLFNPALATDAPDSLLQPQDDPIVQAVYPDLTVDAANGNSPYSISADATYGNVYDGNTSTGVVNHSAGTLTVNTAFYVGNNAGSNGAYNLSGGSLVPTGKVYVGYNGMGSVVQNGTSSVSNANVTTIYLGYNVGSVGSYSLADSATLNLSSGLYIGYNSAGANTLTQSGGTLTTGSYGYGAGIDLGGNKGSSGTFNLSGGIVSVAGFAVGDAGTGVVNQTGGTVSATGSTGLILGKTGYSGSLGNFGGNGSYFLSGGSVTTTNLSLGYANGYLNYGNFVQSGTTTVNASGSVSVGGGALGTGTYSLADTATITSPTLFIGFNSNMNNTFTQTGGMANFTTATYLGYNASTKGTVNLSGGTFSTPNLYDGDSGTGIFMQSGASTVTTTTVHLGPNGQNGPAVYNVGTYSLSGTGTLTGATLYIGETSSGANAFNQSGASANFSSAIYLGYNTGSIGTLNLSGGKLSTAGSLSVGYQGTGTVNQSGGTFTIGTGGVTMGPVGNSSSGTYNLSGGTLVTPAVNGAVGSTFNFNGGTLQAAADSTAFFSVSATNVQAGGARLDTNGHAVTVAQALAHDPALGATADGGLRKSGSGTLTLTGTSTFTGPTTVNAGTLALNAGTNQTLAATGSVTVNTGGTLLLGAANQVNSAAPLTLNANSGPGTGAAIAFDTGGFGQSLGALTLSSTSVINLASGASILHFANSGAQNWTGTLAVWNWTGTVGTGGGTDELLFGANSASLSAAQLAAIQFYSDSGTTALAAAGFAAANTGEVVPGGLFASSVPEPSTWLGGALLLGTAGAIRQRRSRRALPPAC